VVQFLYDGYPRVVEPRMLGANELDPYALSGGFVFGYSHETGPSWRECLLYGIANLKITETTFPAPRSGYNGRKFPKMYCGL